MKKHFLLAALSVILVLSITACSSQSDAPATETASPDAGSFIAEGQLTPARALDLGFGRNGFVSEVLVNNGDTVTNGQALVTLEPSPDALQTLATAQKEALLARQDLEELEASAALDLANLKLAVIEAQQDVDVAQARYDANSTDANLAKLDGTNAQLQILLDKLEKTLANDGIDPDKLAAANARLDAANAALANAESDVDAATLRSKLDGTVVDLNLQSGDYVLLGSTVGAVANYDYWIIKTDNLSEIDVVDLEVGSPVEVTLDSLPDLSFAGEIVNINARYVENRGDVTYTVTIKLNESDPRMRWGMTAAVKFSK